MQRLVPKNVQGQVFGARGALSLAGYPLGAATGGMLMAAIAAPFVIGISALLCSGIGCACLVSPTMREIRRSETGKYATTT